MTPDLAEVRPYAVRVAARMLPAQDVEDAAQVATLAVWRAFPRFDGRDPWPLVVVIVRQSVSGFARRLYSQRETPSVMDEESTRWDPTEEAGLAAHEAGRVRAAVAALPRAQRGAVTLMDLEGWTSQEAATLLGVGEPSGVRQARRNAHAKLREALADLAA